MDLCSKRFQRTIMDGLTDTEVRNWVKACLAIKCVKDGMIPLVESYCSKHSEYTNQKVVHTCKVVKYTCNQCDIKHLKPFHNRGECTYRRCDCKGNFKLACPEYEACGLIYDLIKAAHTSNDPNWTNTDSKLWSTSAWEQVKCYIATPGYKETMNICDADITALIQICLNCNDLESLFHTSIKHLQEVRKIRNEVYHSSKMKVSNDVLTDVFNHTATCLMVVANKYPNCTTEINHQLGVLKRLKSEDYILTTQHESDAVKDAMVGMNHYMAEITDNQRHTGETIKTLSLGLDDLAKMCDTRFAENATETYLLLNDHTSKIDAVIQRQMMENEVKIKESEERNKALFERVKALEVSLKSMISFNQEQAQHTPRRTQVSLESKITIHAEGIDSEEHFTERMGNAADNIIKQKPLNTSNVVLRNYLISSLQVVQKDDNRIIDHREKCLEIYIESPSIHNWMTLCEDFFNGIIATAFREVQRYLRTYEGWENLTLRLELDDEYFAHSVHAVIDHLDRALSNVKSSDTTSEIMEHIKIKIEECQQDIDEHADKHKQDFDEHADERKEDFDENADERKQDFDEHADERKYDFDEHADEHKQDFDEHADERKQDFDEHADERKQDFDEHATQRKQDFDEHANKHIARIMNNDERIGNSTCADTDYKQSCEDDDERLREELQNILPLLSDIKKVTTESKIADKLIVHLRPKAWASGGRKRMPPENDLSQDSGIFSADSQMFLTEIQSLNDEHSKLALSSDRETKTAMIKVLEHQNRKREQTGRKQRSDSGYSDSAGSRSLSERLSVPIQLTVQETGHSNQSTLSASALVLPVNEEADC